MEEAEDLAEEQEGTTKHQMVDTTVPMVDQMGRMVPETGHPLMEEMVRALLPEPLEKHQERFTLAEEAEVERLRKMRIIQELEAQAEAEKVAKGHIQSMPETMNITITAVIMEQQERPTQEAVEEAVGVCMIADMAMPPLEAKEAQALCC